MIIQLPNGRIIECSLEQYLSLTDNELDELYGLGTAYTKEIQNPFYKSYSAGKKAALEDMDDEFNRIESEEKSDTYFHPDDI